MTKQKISPFLWFDQQAEEAAKFYVSIFPDSEVETIVRHPEARVLTVAFRLNGQQFTALNGGPKYKFTEAVSFVVNCETQAEVDHYWDRLSEGAQQIQCGWVKDKFGLSWQIVPNVFLEMIQDKDPARVKRVMDAMLQMKKLDIAMLEKAFHSQ
jgi:predicted 3-demethylubiquinone-9 3-methyltransferase (glyoxalase superfamily)